MTQRSEFEAVPINVPTLAEIRELYEKATTTKNDKLMGAAEQAVYRLAAAEAAAAEAATLVSFFGKTTGETNR